MHRPATELSGMTSPTRLLPDLPSRNGPGNRALQSLQTASTVFVYSYLTIITALLILCLMSGIPVDEY